MNQKEMIVKMVDELQEIKMKEFYSVPALARLVKIHLHTLGKFLKYGRDNPLMFRTETLRNIKKFIEDYNAGTQ